MLLTPASAFEVQGAKDELFTLTKITELILREVVSRCAEDNARAVTDVLSIQAKEGSKTPFDLVSNCLDAAAFLSDHPLRKYLKQVQDSANFRISGLAGG